MIDCVCLVQLATFADLRSLLISHLSAEALCAMVFWGIVLPVIPPWLGILTACCAHVMAPLVVLACISFVASWVFLYHEPVQLCWCGNVLKPFFVLCFFQPCLGCSSAACGIFVSLSLSHLKQQNKGLSRSHLASIWTSIVEGVLRVVFHMIKDLLCVSILLLLCS